MNDTTFNSNSSASRRQATDDTLSSLIAAMPVVIFFKAAREALQGTSKVRLQLSAAR